ncbi:MAG: branched-chain amino acid ABC transporter permease [Rhodospirillum sp.]|nr:branched-chain amino acid ABC transporter permease [Rhodospirillum sp.]MCF8489712.1 branched-chain amino acid ABC transporter permease [Rhodospirillum sp.]MCF8502575.1 branched-chain amino acid ABC transporter permease [Rhodospirillum sp.]
MSKPLVIAGALAALVCVIPYLVADRYVFHVAIMGCVTLILASSMNLMLRVGQLSLAQVAFMGIGAYASALFSMRLGWPTGLSLVAGGGVAMVFAAVLGPAFLKIRGVYFVLLTFAFAQAVNLIFQDWTSLLGGNNGLYGIPKLELFGIRLGKPGAFYGLALAVALGWLALMGALHRSRVGAVLSSIEENEDLTRSLGVNVLAWRIGCFALSGLMAGIAGGLYAYYIGFLSPQAFTFHTSVNVLVINVIGGVASPLGPLIGSILIVPLPELLRDVEEYQLLAYGGILILFLAFFPRGLIGFLAEARQDAAGRRLGRPIWRHSTKRTK